VGFRYVLSSAQPTASLTNRISAFRNFFSCRDDILIKVKTIRNIFAIMY